LHSYSHFFPFGGGAPVTRDFAEKIGADGYAPDAGSAADLCKKLLA